MPVSLSTTTRATLRVEEAAEVIGIARSTAYAAVARGEIPTVRIGRRLMVPVGALRELLSATGPTS